MKWEKSLAACAACAVAFGGLALATPVFAQSSDLQVVRKLDLPTKRVSYRDLNLATFHGEQTLVSRVKVAVRQVCPMGFATRAHSGTIKCRNYAWDGAKPQIDRAVFRARQMAANGTSVIAPVAIQITAPPF